jgi:hypothetical protein
MKKSKKLVENVSEGSGYTFPRPPMSLDEALKDKTLGKWDVYSAITGKDWWGAGLGLGEIHPFNITQENMDKVYLVIKRMQRDKYYHDPTNPEHTPLHEYYKDAFEKIDQAFLKNDTKEFKKAVEDLLSRIVLD